ncbi:MAG: hypothetical protein KAX19_10265 [Candidatus Brocadiae bacterium]|nr:hypothetical protein [Candidatus Brocadiia bacterium]
MRREMLLFDKGGPQNTDATLGAARRRAEELGITKVVLATSSGETALKALEAFEGMDVQVIGVTLHAGYWGLYSGPDKEKVAAAEAKGVKFLTATHSLMGSVESAIKDKFGGIAPMELIAHTYYTFSQGMKVAVEVTLMAADAGLVENAEDIIAVGGTDEGADTAVVLKAAYTTNFFDLKVREVLAMPR